MIATLFMQSGCIESLSAAAVLADHAVPFLTRDVRHDADAESEVVDWYRELRPDAVPATPVVVLPGGEVCFGAMQLHAALSGAAAADLAVAA